MFFHTYTQREQKSYVPPPFSLSLSLSLSLVHVKLYMCFIHLCQAQKSYALSELLSICHSVSWFLILILCSILLHLLFSVSHTDKLVHSHASSSLSLSLSLSWTRVCSHAFSSLWIAVSQHLYFWSLSCCELLWYCPPPVTPTLGKLKLSLLHPFVQFWLHLLSQLVISLCNTQFAFLGLCWLSLKFKLHMLHPFVAIFIFCLV